MKSSSNRFSASRTTLRRAETVFLSRCNSPPTAHDFPYFGRFIQKVRYAPDDRLCHSASGVEGGIPAAPLSL
ncbi:hypothetical protein NL676_008230 [Syzygium grande]|nr:hypothetical protein NL676_008230 [Syzygium grande]